MVIEPSETVSIEGEKMTKERRDESILCDVSNIGTLKYIHRTMRKGDIQLGVERASTEAPTRPFLGPSPTHNHHRRRSLGGACRERRPFCSLSKVQCVDAAMRWIVDLKFLPLESGDVFDTDIEGFPFLSTASLLEPSSTSPVLSHQSSSTSSTSSLHFFVHTAKQRCHNYSYSDSCGAMYGNMVCSVSRLVALSLADN